MPYETPDIRAMRKKLGWTQQELSDRTGITQGWISQLEGGSVDSVTVGTLRYIVEVMEKSARRRKIDLGDEVEGLE